MLAPMGRAVIGGVITSTVLTLLIVPVLYTYLYRLGEWVKTLRQRKAAAAVQPL
jgi:HAE1 family hydrophobic/amphiphilic exporter-1